PSVVRRPNGELLVAFRRAPDRRIYGDGVLTHTDADSQLVLVRSRDSGETWTQTPSLIFAHPFGGSQDPCMVQLRDGSILCTSYGWAPVGKEFAGKLKDVVNLNGFVFMGGYLLRSTDGGNSWQQPIIPPALPFANVLNHLGQIAPVANRGAMCEGRDGRLFWAVANGDVHNPDKTSVYLMTSTNRGLNWNYSCPIATHEKIAFNETSLFETPKGELVAFLRTENFNDHTCVARSTDGGKSFAPWQDAGFQGHPHYALRLPDQRVLLIYGYRHPPFGVRARILDAECKDLDAKEIIIRADGGNGDVGYPWATMLSKKRLLVVYYLNQANGPRYIAGTILGLE
ncbi:MAG TPA: sialidase family protein, partial [Verrucomicrobiae bacterium]|nr:sialidase family protein [Verrucomicrobiae bacterium]